MFTVKEADYCFLYNTTSMCDGCDQEDSSYAYSGDDRDYGDACSADTVDDDGPCSYADQ